MVWIEAQSTFVIGVLVFGFCYLLATVTLCVALMLSRRAVAQSLKAIAPTTLTPLGVILGLLIGFLAARVTATRRRTRSALSAGRRSHWPSSQWYSAHGSLCGRSVSTSLPMAYAS